MYVRFLVSDSFISIKASLCMLVPRNGQPCRFGAQALRPGLSHDPGHRDLPGTPQAKEEEGITSSGLSVFRSPAKSVTFSG